MQHSHKLPLDYPEFLRAKENTKNASDVTILCDVTNDRLFIRCTILKNWINGKKSGRPFFHDVIIVRNTIKD